MELYPLVSMRVDGILYFPYHNVGHDSLSVKSDGNGLVLTQLINMAKTAQENYSFGDFSGLPPDEQDAVQHILHGANLESGQKKIEFPWDKDGSPLADDLIPYEAYNGNPPPPPPSVVPVATLYPRTGPVPHIPAGGAIFQSPLVPLVFTQPVNLSQSQINRPSVVGPPPGMIPINLTMVNHDFIPPPSDASLEVVNNDSVIPPVSNHVVTVHEYDQSQPSMPVTNTSVKENGKLYEGNSVLEPSLSGSLKSEAEDTKSGDLKNIKQCNKRVQVKNCRIDKVDPTSFSMIDKSGQAKPDCDNVPSGKLEKSIETETQMLETISFFDSEISGNGILPNDNLQLKLHNDHYIITFPDQKSNSNQTGEGSPSDTNSLNSQAKDKPLPTTAPSDNDNLQSQSSDQSPKPSDHVDSVVNSSLADVNETKSPENAKPVVESSAVAGENVPNSLESESQTPTVDVTKDADSVTSTESVETVSQAKDKNISPTPQLPKMKSWAGLFRNTETTSKSIVVYSGTSDRDDELTVSKRTSSPASVDRAATGKGMTSATVPKPSPEREFVKESTPQLPTPVAVDEDLMAMKIGAALKDMNLIFRPVALQPRALNNKGNWCYINATLQALLSCPPFYHLIKKLPLVSIKQRGPSSTPVLDAMFQFMNEFNTMPNSASKKRSPSAELIPGPPFEPSCVYNMLHMIESTLSFKFGKQEDAEEFLSFVLNKLHEEMLAVVNVANNNPNQSDENHNSRHKENGFLPDENANTDDDWEQVGPKNKTVYTRRANFTRSCVSDIFAGQMRSAVYQVASKESATLQPFFTLQLDIQSDKVWNVKDALEGLVSKEAVHGYTCSKTNTEVEITKKVTLEELPPVLILHFKCFIYDKNGGIQKVLKKIDYPIELDISKELLSPVRSRIPMAQRSYKLFAVIFHHGKNATGGHYTACVYHCGINNWILYDDGVVRQVSPTHVLKFVLNRIPYLLFYRRCDLS
ncbi:ubiquitin carboxyl-terminal hydrolase 10-A [Octopus bimaculoides]|uniref:ubiquitinyl hydrolase 1 n=1 Tax=Octopus bimaculoides TaxID=37653 RepID=A0A0L8FH33_OCTBM|nr:ubiquitin carboxyl-terminal hydrolase 10-A [Octopus bimaculoides]|eukprot:XP_014789899.1 PREDICTED: ubiquitin carboxyl-terminal hydrolase 10-A-like [Octopus bimaculoides]